MCGHAQDHVAGEGILAGLRTGDPELANDAALDGQIVKHELPAKTKHMIYIRTGSHDKVGAVIHEISRIGEGKPYTPTDIEIEATILPVFLRVGRTG